MSLKKGFALNAYLQDLLCSQSTQLINFGFLLRPCQALKARCSARGEEGRGRGREGGLPLLSWREEGGARSSQKGRREKVARKGSKTWNQEKRDDEGSKIFLLHCQWCVFLKYFKKQKKIFTTFVSVVELVFCVSMSVDKQTSLQFLSWEMKRS